EPLLVVLKDSPLREVKDLRGKVVTVSDTLATLTLAARRYLAEMGLPPGSALTVRAMGTHVNSLAALVHGESSAAVISVTALKQMGVDWGDRIRVLARIPPTPPLLYMVHRRLGTETIDRLQRQLLRFANETSEGQDLFRRLAHDGLKPVTAADLAALDSFAQDVKRLLEAL
ncbi:MAG: phosphate/phosphite/phosphonate ABC transporter substrate-binding protein, partial [Tepidimonas sp.]|nr:phosphate/phosphite/phosphonate ABC transporter substrate-binding protein [Tepidimonas sp.]